MVSDMTRAKKAAPPEHHCPQCGHGRTCRTYNALLEVLVWKCLGCGHEWWQTPPPEGFDPDEIPRAGEAR